MPSLPDDDYRELLIGCGNRRIKEAWRYDDGQDWKSLTTLDIDPNCGADIEWDLERFPYPFPDDHFDEIHAYEVLEHCGTQGDYRFFFRQFEEFWRIMKPAARLVGSVPKGEMTWGDPGHRRALSLDTFGRLNQNFYTEKVGTNCPVGDYRFCYRADFDVFSLPHIENPERLFFIIQAVKPSRISI